jgi:hypothetical protein
VIYVLDALEACRLSQALRTWSGSVICGGVAPSADRGRYSARHEQDTDDDQSAMASSYYQCDHSSDSDQKAKRDSEHGVRLNRVDQSNHHAAEHL